MAPLPTPTTRKNKTLSLDMKMKIIKMKRDGKRNCEISRAFKVGESTVRMVWKNCEQIEKAAKTYGGQTFDNRSQSTNTVMIHMERYLAHYLNLKDKEGVPIDGKHIKEQAKIFYAACLENVPDPPKKPFKASTGWLNKFLKRKRFKKARFCGESGSADTEAADSFPNTLKKIIEEGGYTKDQIFNLDESGLNWKKMPSSTYIAKQQKQAHGKKIDESRFTVMFTVNVSGSCKMKPVIVHTAEHPHSFNDVHSMSSFDDFYWYSSCNGWITSAIMKDWLLDHFVPDSRLKCHQLGLPFKVLLLMDNAPCHPTYLCDIHPDVKIVFFPPNTTSLVQPLNQEIIANVKNFYLTRLFGYLRAKTKTDREVQEIEAENVYGDLDVDDPLPDDQPDNPPDLTATGPVAPEMTVHQFWRQFTVRNAVEFLVESWGEINVATIHHGWHSVVPHLVPKEASSQVQQVAESQRAVVAAAQEVAGCQDVTEEEVRELQDEEESTQTAMLRIDKEDELARECDSVNNPQPVEQGTTSMCQLANILAGLDTFKDIVCSNDRDRMHAEEICISLDRVIRFYAEKHREGGGPTKATQLSATEEAMTAIISDDAIGGHPEVSDVVEVPEDLMAKEEEYPEDPLMIIEDAYSIPIEMTPGRITGGTASSSPCQEGDAPLDPTSAGQETEDRGTPSPCDRRYPRTYNCRERRSNLHTVFTRKKKFSPSGLGRKNIKPYYLMDVLQFHPPYLKEHQPTDIQGNEPSLEQASEEVNEDSFQEIADEHCEGNVPQESDAIPPTYNKGASANSAERRKRNNLSAIDQTFVDFINLTKARVNSEDDPRKLFLMSLLPDVHAMTEVQMRKFRKLVLHAVDTVLEEPSNNIHMNFSPS